MNRFMRKHRRRINGMFVNHKIHGNDMCVSCRVDTHVPTTLDISQRIYYITGVGQFCHDCYDVLFTDHLEKHFHDAV